MDDFFYGILVGIILHALIITICCHFVDHGFSDKQQLQLIEICKEVRLD